MGEHQTFNWVRFPLAAPCCVLEQDTLTTRNRDVTPQYKTKTSMSNISMKNRPLKRRGGSNNFQVPIIYVLDQR